MFEPQGEHAKIVALLPGQLRGAYHDPPVVARDSFGRRRDGRSPQLVGRIRGTSWRFKRPMLLQIDGSTDVVVRDITMLDSPRFNLYLGSYCRRVLVERVTILADWAAQQNLQKSVPMFPFNTDGIDVAGKDITIRDIVVSNYDDVVAVKAADLLSDDGARLHAERDRLQHHSVPRRRPVGGLRAPVAAQAVRPRRIVRASDALLPAEGALRQAG